MAMLVLVTGATGYVGRAVVTVLREHGHDVRPLSRPADLLTPASLDQAHDVDAVVHLAALTSVRDSVANPTKVWRTNVTGTLNLLEALPHGARLVFASTGSVYGTPERQPIAETAPTRPLNPYGASKLAAEQLIGAQANTGAIGAVTLRLFSAAGRYDPDLSRIIPKVVAVARQQVDRQQAGQQTTGQQAGQQTAAGERAVTINGDGQAIRDFVHVDDLATAIAKALTKAQLKEHKIYNVGAIPVSVADIVAAAERVSGRRVPVVHHPANPGEARELRADTTKIRTELGWTPVHTSLDELVKAQWASHAAG